MNEDTETEDRLTAEWEPEVKVNRKGINNRSLRRKLVTTGIEYFEQAELIDLIESKCRAGKEVRITRRGEAVVRFLPIADKGLVTIGLKAQTMGSLLNALRDLTIKFFRRFGKRVKKSEVMKDAAEYAERYDNYHEAIQSITPDMMATCPECGTRFRIGKQLK